MGCPPMAADRPQDRTRNLDRERLWPLFEGHSELRAVIDGVLEGHLGEARADHPEHPSCARLSLGVYEIFGGAAERGAPLMAEVPRPCECLLPGGDGGWLRVARGLFGAALEGRDMRTFDASRLDRAHLTALANGLPEPYRRQPVDAHLARRMGPELAPNRVANFGTPETFLRAGFGLCVLAGDEIAAAATTYSVSSRAAEIAIATHPAHSRRGLALALGAAILSESLARGLEPVWTAAHDGSTRVAQRLGLVPKGWCRTYDLADRTPGTAPA